jgi:hypothetical protein
MRSFDAIKVSRLLSMALLATTLLFATEDLYSAEVVTTQQTTSAQPSKPARFHYVCPMHEDVVSSRAGRCPKCKMTLEKRRIKEPTAASDQ